MQAYPKVTELATRTKKKLESFVLCFSTGIYWFSCYMQSDFLIGDWKEQWICVKFLLQTPDICTGNTWIAER